MGNRTHDPGCLVEQAVNHVFDDAFHAAEELLLTRFGNVTLAELSTDFRARTVVSGFSFDTENIHAA